MQNLLPVTPAQCRAGRALVGWSLQDLSSAAGLPATAVEAFEAERLSTPDEGCAQAVRAALEAAGVLFLPEMHSAGVGVRLKFPRQTVKRLQAWEGEGGATGEDDVS